MRLLRLWPLPPCFLTRGTKVRVLVEFGAPHRALVAHEAPDPVARVTPAEHRSAVVAGGRQERPVCGMLHELELSEGAGVPGAHCDVIGSISEECEEEIKGRARGLLVVKRPFTSYRSESVVGQT